MPSVRRSDISTGVQFLAIALTGIVFFQAIPVGAMLQSTGPVHQCECADGVCPRDANGECTCDHHGPSATTHAHNSTGEGDGPMFRPCGAEQPPAIVAASSIKALVGSVSLEMGPRARPVRPTPAMEQMSPQRTGDDVFHPPRVIARLQRA